MTTLAQLTGMISGQRLTDTLVDLIDIPSPTGEEAPLAAHIVDTLRASGIDAEVQALDERQANAVGWLRQGRADAAAGDDTRRLLLYSPVDTVTSNSEAEDIPWAGPELRGDMRAAARAVDGHVFGLGAQNPKGHAACVIEAARVLRELQAELGGDLYFGFGAGGMPTHARPGLREDSGHGAGCKAMIEHLPTMDAAIIAKSGDVVTWEEVGFIWMEVTVAGTHTYVGSRHLLPYTNAIAEAAKLVLKLEDWFEQRAARLQTDCVRPQAVISHIEAGWKRMPAFTPACCRFLADVRFGPRQTADETEAEFRSALAQFCDDLGVVATARRTQTIEASHTAPDSPIITTAIASWEAIKGRPHQPFTVLSGATDANMLRHAGIPTARVGLPKASLPDIDFQLGMNCASVAALRDLTLLLVSASLQFLGAPAHG